MHQTSKVSWGLAIFVLSAGAAEAKPGLTVHEWGTFTSVAGQNGVGVDWSARSAPGDLPSFVYRAEDLGPQRGTRNAYRSRGKGDVHLVRMETPVLYFYSDAEREVSARVDFPKGRITEWYPHAALPKPGDGGFVDWGRFKVLPSSTAALPDEHRPSHYYAAREVDAAPLQLCGGEETEVEKFLFYRGVGDIALPLRVKLDGNQLALSGPPGQTPLRVMVFERRGAHTGYRWSTVGSAESRVARPELSSSLPEVLGSLEAELTATGLFPREAKAMIKTWTDQWFEDGVRVFYVLPRADTDAALPLHVEPSPEQLVRTLVARVEVLTPEQIRSLRSELDGVRALPAARRPAALASVLARRGRFAQPLLARLSPRDAEEEAAWRDALALL